MTQRVEWHSTSAKSMHCSNAQPNAQPNVQPKRATQRATKCSTKTRNQTCNQSAQPKRATKRTTKTIQHRACRLESVSPFTMRCAGSFVSHEALSVRRSSNPDMSHHITGNQRDPCMPLILSYRYIMVHPDIHSPFRLHYLSYRYILVHPGTHSRPPHGSL